MRDRYTVENYAELTKRFSSDLKTLNSFMGESNNVAKTILSSNDKGVLFGIRQRLSSYNSMSLFWRTCGGEYYILKPMLDKASLLLRAEEEKERILGIKGRKIERNSVLYPALSELSDKFGINPFENTVGIETRLDSPSDNYLNSMPLPSDDFLTERSFPNKSELKQPKTNENLVEKIKGKIFEKTKEKNLESVPSETSPRPTEAITFDTLLRYYKNKGLVGEEQVALIQTFGAIHKLCFGIESMSGSGKSFTVDILFSLLPKDDVYRMELSSKTAEFYEADAINKAKIIYLPELQKAMNSNPLVIEMLKNITEGKDASRKVRDSSNGTNINTTIKADKGVIFTLAMENNFKYDVEFARRVFFLHTDISAEQTDRILKKKANGRHKIPGLERLITPEEETELKGHIKNCLNLGNLVFENPFSDYLSSFIPRTIRSRSYDDYYFDLVEAVTKFNYLDRLSDGNIFFVEIADVHAVHELYWHQFCKSLLGIPLIGEEILKGFNGKPKSLETIYIEQKAANPSITKVVVECALDRMTEVGLLDKSNLKREYLKQADLSVFDKQVSWEEAWESGLDFMDKNYPHLSDKWEEKQVTGGVIPVINPISGEVSEVVSVADKPAGTI